MSNVNIRRDVQDSFYRYKMPKLLAKIEGRGNGIKTLIPNMSAISLALSRPPTYATKYFGFELGALVTIDEKTDRYIVNGAHGAEDLAKILDVFIKKYVLCGDCQNPETDLIVKRDDISRECRVCGAKTSVESNHRLSTFIVKNPPPRAHADKKGVSDSKEESAPVEDGDEVDDELTRQINKDAETLKNVHIDEDDWAEDMSAEAVAARQKDSSSSAINKILDDDNTDVMELFASFVNGNPDASIEEVKLEALKLGIDDDKVLVILFQILFSESTLNAASIALKAPLFKQFLTSEKCQKGLLGGFERTVGELFPSLLPKTPILLKALYDNDLVDEEVILAWGQKASKRFVDKKVSKEIRTKAEPFLKWLQEAEEDEEED